MSNSPEMKFRIGMLTANVWKNERNARSFFSVTLERSYKDGDEFKSTNALGASDLLNAAKLLERAEAWIAVQ